MMSKHSGTKTDSLVLSLLILLTALLWGGAVVALVQHMVTVQSAVISLENTTAY